MNALAILQHAYQSIASAHPEKDAFQIVADIEALAVRIAVAASGMERRISVLPEDLPQRQTQDQASG